MRMVRVGLALGRGARTRSQRLIADPLTAHG
jgi:hypothetical protein